jgi:hypothetical protein
VASDATPLAPLFTARATALQRLGHDAAAERDCDRALELDQARASITRALRLRVPRFAARRACLRARGVQRRCVDFGA